MNEAVKRRIAQMKKIAADIKATSDYINTQLNAVETDDDLDVVEMSFDSIERWANEGYDICRNTYDEFEEEP